MDIVEFLEADLSDYLDLKIKQNSIKTYVGGQLYMSMGDRYATLVISNGKELPSKYELDDMVKGIVKYSDGTFEPVRRKPEGYYYKQIARIEGCFLFKAKIMSDRCTVKALNAIDEKVSEYITVKNAQYEYAVPPVVSFTIQSDPVSEVGVNGCQVSDMLEYVKNLFVAADEAFPCDENKQTILKLKEAIHWQDARTKDRIRRNVEGKNAI